MFIPMSRTRAERRHLSNRAQARRRKLCGETEYARQNGISLVCGGKMTPGGEAKSCSRCETCRYYEDRYWASLQAKKLSSYITSIEE